MKSSFVVLVALGFAVAQVVDARPRNNARGPNK